MSKSINKWHGVGNLTRDPEVKYVPSGIAVASLSIACNESYKDKQSGEWKERVEYVNIKAWGRMAEVAGECLRKGKQVYVEGSLRTDSWDDKKTGQKRYSTYINTSELVLLGGKSNGDSLPSSDRHDYSRHVSDEEVAQQITDDDIPF